MAEREDRSSRRGINGATQQGLGTKRPLVSPPAPSAPLAAPPGTSMLPPPLTGSPGQVEFDALNAALGHPAEKMPTVRSIQDELLGSLGELTKSAPASNGQPSATYASVRPHAIPKAYGPLGETSIPAVIVADDDTVPSGPPNMTVPLSPARLASVAPALSRSAPPPSLRPPTATPSGAPGSGPGATSGRPGAPPSDAIVPRTSIPVPAAGLPPMASRPALPYTVPPAAVRRERALTIVVRSREPTRAQKVAAFLGMLLVFTTVGVAVVVLRQPGWVALFIKDHTNGEPVSASDLVSRAEQGVAEPTTLTPLEPVPLEPVGAQSAPLPTPVEARGSASAATAVLPPLVTPSASGSARAPVSRRASHAPTRDPWLTPRRVAAASEPVPVPPATQ